MKPLKFIISVSVAIWLGLLVAAAAPRPRPELQFGTPSDDFVARAGYIQARATHYTPWVLEHLTAANFHERALRSDFDFYADDEQPAECRWTNRDYLASGYDKGHLAPAADNVHSAIAMRESFYLTNTMPQTPELNRGPWRMLEEHVCQLVEAGGGTEAWVATGPAFLPIGGGALMRDGSSAEYEMKFRVIGSGRLVHNGTHDQPSSTDLGGRLWVPSHCWKAVLLKRGDKFEAFAWMLPNTSKPPAFDKCQVSIDEIEAATGFDFFAGLDDEVEEELEAKR